MAEAIIILTFLISVTALSTAGLTLFLFVWAHRWPRATRSLVAAGLGSACVLTPIMLLGGEGRFETGDLALILLAIGIPTAVVGLPTALLCNRMLERLGNGVAAAFE